MTGFLFGERARQLYGYYHAPVGAVHHGTILMCHPWGTEYHYAHRTLRLLAARLARQGWHVLRFDYSGTGDSWGDATDADLQVWLDDVRQAADELRVISGFETANLIGLRLGATVAALASERLGAVKKRVLWEPILAGQAWLTEISRWSTPELGEPSPQGKTELGGQTVSQSFREQLAGIRSPPLGDGAIHTLLLWTESPGDDLLDGHGNAPEVERLLQPSPWVEDVAIGSGQVPVDALNRIVEWMGE